MTIKGKSPAYNEDVVNHILEGIETQGTDKAGYQGVINPSTFYEWLKRYPEFAEKVKQSRMRYTFTRSRKMRAKIRRTVEEYAENGLIEEWETEEVNEDKDGNVLSVRRTKKKVRRPASWAIERVLGKPLNEIEAVKVLIENGWLAADKVNRVEAELEVFNEKVKDILNN